MNTNVPRCLILSTAAACLLCLVGSHAVSLPTEATPFATWAKAYTQNPDQDVLLPNPEKWFAAHFPKELAAAIASDYQDLVKKSGGRAGIGKLVRGWLNAGNSEVSVVAVSRPDDPEATGLQQAALQQMTQPVTLYTIKLRKPGHSSGISFWSFVELDGTYRLVGKMQPVMKAKKP
jgi:hypothetical protein